MTAQWKKDEPTIPTGACTGSYGGQDNINLAVNGTKEFSYTGNVRCAYLQKAGYYKLEVWGASGGGDSSYAGYGGYSYGKIYSSSASSLYVVVGNTGTYNNSAIQSNDANGGGATHMSTYNCGELKNCSSYKGTYNSSIFTYDGGKILIVAGGGGGSYGSGYIGGNGGGYIGGNGNASEWWGYGGTQTEGKSHYAGSNYTTATWYPTSGGFGYGGYFTTTGYGGRYGGGSGWFGGGAACGGGGGSGYIGNSLLLSDKGMYQYSGGAGGCSSSTAAATKTTCTSYTGAHIANYANKGNGYAKITYLGT